MSVEATDLDPITFEVLRSGFEHAADRMSTVLQRASFSPIIYDSVDFSNAVFDPEGQLVGQTANCPVHLAAMHFVPECNENPERTFDINVMGTRNLLSAARTLDNLESFVYASSAAVYPPKATPLAETETPGPLDVYGRTKLVGEDLVDLFHRDTGVDTVSARLFNVFGPRETNPHLIPEIVEQIASSSRIELGNLAPKRDYVHVTDVARALHRMLDVEGQRTYNVGTGEAHSVRRVAELATNAVTEEFSVEQSQDRVRESDRKNLQADIDRIRGELRWEPRVSLESGLEALLTDHGVR